MATRVARYPSNVNSSESLGLTYPEHLVQIRASSGAPTNSKTQKS